MRIDIVAMRFTHISYAKISIESYVDLCIMVNMKGEINMDKKVVYMVVRSDKSYLRTGSPNLWVFENRHFNNHATATKLADALNAGLLDASDEQEKFYSVASANVPANFLPKQD